MMTADASAPPPNIWNRRCLIFVIASLATAALYLGLQWVHLGQFRDPVFVGLLVANTVTVCRAGAYLQTLLRRTANDLPEMPQSLLANPAPLRTAIFDDPRAWAAAMIMGGLLAAGALLVLPWQTNPDLPIPVARSLDLALAALIFACNLAVGMALFAVWKFCREITIRFEQIDIPVFNTSRPDLVAYMDISRVIVLTTALVACIAVGSLLVSPFRFNLATLAFSGFAFLVTFAAYVLPLAPYTARLKQAKFQTLNELEQKIAKASETARAPGTDTQPQYDEISSLLALRAEIRKIRCFPPDGQFSFATAASVTFLTFLPILAENILQQINGG